MLTHYGPITLEIIQNSLQATIVTMGWRRGVMGNRIQGTETDDLFAKYKNYD